MVPCSCLLAWAAHMLLDLHSAMDAVQATRLALLQLAYHVLRVWRVWRVLRVLRVLHVLREGPPWQSIAVHIPHGGTGA